MRKHRRPPEILWMLFGNRVRTLAETITSLLPPHPSSSVPKDCRFCKGRRCLSCRGGANGMSFLLRRNDPAAYRNLLSRSFAVVSENAPEVTRFSPDSNWSQIEIVRAVIEFMMVEQPSSTNVIWSCYDKCNQSSPNLELLNTKAWRLLLERVGDGIMVYLLRNASIFLTMPLQKHQQVTGPPISDLCGKKSKGVKRSYNQQSSISPCGRGKKRKREDNVHSMLKRQKLCGSFITSKTSSSSTCNGCYSDSGLDGNKHSHNPTSSVTNDHDGNLNQEHQESSERLRKRSRPFSWQRRRNRRLLSSQETSNQDCCRVLTTEQFSGSLSTDKTNSFAVCNDNGFDSSKHIHTPTSTLIEGCDGDLNQNPQQGPEGLKKRSRPFSWQRRRKRMLLPPKETSIQDPLPTILGDKESLPGRLLCCLEQNCDHKCSCFGFRIPRKVAKEAQIDRKFMFFNLEHSSSAFPRNHVLNSLRPNSASSEFLVKSIFGISEKESARSKKCPYGSSLCVRGSASLGLWMSASITIIEGFCVVVWSTKRMQDYPQRYVWKCLFQLLWYHSLAELLKILIRRAQRFHTGKLLEKHCGVSGPSLNCKKKCAGILEGDNWQNSVLKKCQRHITDHCISSREAADGSSEPIESYCSKSQVVSFIWAVCRGIIPADFLGSTSNWRILRRNIYKFVCLRRFEKFSLKQCMHKLKTSKFPFLSNNQYFCSMNSEALKGLEGKRSNMHKGLAKLNDAAHIVKQRVLESWIYWFFASIVVPVLQANFYITESEYGKQDVYYYQKSVWEKVKNKAITCMKDQRYHYLNDATTRRIIRRRSFGFSKLRICPKGCGMRLLANLRASSRMPRKEFNLEGQSTGRRRTKKDQTKVKFEHFKSVNGVLRDTHAVIKDIRLKEPDKLGSSVFDYNDVYRKFCPFVIGLKNGSTIMPDVFIVVSDVSKAFDTVDQDKLLSVMNDIIRTDEYFVKHSYEVLCTKGSLWVHENPALVDQNTSLRFRSSARYRSLHTVLVNQECSRSLKREELFFNLNQHIKRNVLQLDRKFYLQGVGIPQGSILSSLLCSLYYGHLDRNVIFPFLERTLEAGKEELSRGHSYEGASAGQSGNEEEIPSSASYILQRFIDDFLFISTSRNQAASFFSRLQRGFRDYNCYMNEKKFCVNFEIPHIPGMSSSRVYLGEDGILFLRWSGLLINSCTLEVQADYTKYLNNHLSSTLTVSWEGPPRRHLKAKLCAYMRPKCHPIFFDSNINSASVVRLNIYQAFLICAMKFHCYVRDVSYVWKLCSRSCANIVKSSLRYMKTLIKRRFRSAYNRFDFQPILQLKKGEIEWLGLFAYVQVLKRKQSRHKELISLLTSKLSSHRITRSVSSQLSYAVDRSHSSLIWKIKY